MATQPWRTQLRQAHRPTGLQQQQVRALLAGVNSTQGQQLFQVGTAISLGNQQLTSRSGEAAMSTTPATRLLAEEVLLRLAGAVLSYGECTCACRQVADWQTAELLAAPPARPVSIS